MKTRALVLVVSFSLVIPFVLASPADAGLRASSLGAAPARTQAGIVIPAEWAGIWTSVDSTYDCQGVLQSTGVSTDTLCAGKELALDDAGSFTMDCTGSTTATTVDMTCVHTEEIVTDCNLTLTITLQGTRTGDSYVVTNTVLFDYAGTAPECGFIPDDCTRYVIHATRIAPEPAAYCASPVAPTTWGRMKSQYR